ncbi:histidine kinase [Nocardioides sp. NPDC006273]|uniref:sensor histidine kinase n=1 Tax=Nocardioides sp. NPDC006273 TaxID=3155598 RepID=UPI00339FB5D9
MLGTLEAVALLPLIVLSARAAPARQAVVASVMAHAACTLWVLRFLPRDSASGTLAACVFWSLLATSAVVVGLYLRSLDAERARAVTAARRSQRLELARDLHDFVAHDVSEMVAQAQAGRFIGEEHPQKALAALERIEEAGLTALASMDRTIHMLHDVDEESSAGQEQSAASRPIPGLADLPRLVDRFAASSPADVRLDLDLALTDIVAREVTATAYRVVVEALTNIRRHAPAAARVDVQVQVAAGPTLMITVVNDDGTPSVRGPVAAHHRRGGLGLPGLTERVQSLGGTLAASPGSDGGWNMTVILPMGDTVVSAS